MYDELRTDVYALADEDVAVIRDEDGRVVMVPRSVAKAGAEARAAVDAVMRQALLIDEATRELEDLVQGARDLGLSWDAIGWAVGTTGNAARYRWGTADEAD